MFPEVMLMLILAIVLGVLSTAALAAALRIEKQQRSHFELLSERLRTLEQRVLKLLGHFSKAGTETQPTAEQPRKVLDLQRELAGKSEAVLREEALKARRAMASASRPATGSGPIVPPQAKSQPRPQSQSRPQPRPQPKPQFKSQPKSSQPGAVRKPSPEAGAAFENGTKKPTPPKPADQTPKPSTVKKPAPMAIQVVDAVVVPEKEFPEMDTKKPTPPKPTSQRTTESPRDYVPSRMPANLSPLEARTKEILGKIWNWIIVGEEYRPKDVSMEFAIATNWLLRIGALILIVGVGFFLKYASERGILPPQVRVILTAVGSLIGMVGGALLLGRKKYHLLGQGLVGISTAALYFTVYSAMKRFDMIDQIPAFLLMALITCVVCGIAYRFNTILVALMGVMGGYLTPIILSTDVPNLPGLMAYLTILTAGVLALSYVKDWHLLRAVSLLGTWGLSVAAMGKIWWDKQPIDFAVAIPFTIGFFVMFSTMSFVYNLMKRKEATLLELSMMWLNAVTFFCVSYGLFEITYGADDGLICCKQFAAVTLGMALFYTIHIYYFMAKKIEDRVLLSSFFAIASFMLIITVPILISREFFAVSWAIQAMMMLWLGQKLNSRFLEQVAMVIYTLVFCMFFVDLARHFVPNGLQGSSEVVVEHFWRSLLERLLTFGTMLGSFFGGAWFLSRRQKSLESFRVADANNSELAIDQQVMSVLLAAVGICLGFLYLNVECFKTFNHVDAMLTAPAMTALWVGLAAVLLFQYLRSESDAVLACLVFVMVAVTVKLAAVDMMGWDITQKLWYETYSAKTAMIRLFDFGIIIAMFSAMACFLRGAESDKGYRQSITATVGAIILLFVYTSLELYSALHHFAATKGGEMGGISILWSLYALSFVVIGIWKDVRALRYAGLALFGVVSVKVFFFDLAQVKDELYRIIAFIALGVILIGGSFVYMRCRQYFMSRD